MTSIREAEELVGKAERGEWSLECDGKVLELMQNVAKKIETRSAATKSSIDKMMLNLDETKVKLSNLTRINSIKNTKFCENLIRADHLDDGKNDDTQKEVVKLSPQIAIENGLKLMENCFEKHQVNFDPSSSASQSTVYRPIDKYMNVLPHLIGSEKWKHQWHVGLIDETITQPHESKPQKENVESSQEQVMSSIPSSLDRTSLMASQDSLAKSVSSVDERATFNPEVFTDDDDNLSYTSPVVPNTSKFFHDQIEHRKIVNLFDDEPPSLNQSPVLVRKPVNLFEDYSDESIAASENIENPKQQHQQPQFQQPVDLFNDNEFDDFIKKIEERPENKKEVATTVEVKKPVVSKPLQGNIQYDISNIIEEVKTVHSNKHEPIAQTSKTMVKEKEKTEPKPRTTNIFDDDDQDDYFNEIIKQKSVNKTNQIVVQPQTIPVKSKFTSLFDDEDEGEESFDDIFKKKIADKVTAPEAVIVKTKSSLKSSLFDDDDDEPLATSTKQNIEYKIHKEENFMTTPKTIVTTNIPKSIPLFAKVDEAPEKPEAFPIEEPEIVPEVERKEKILEIPSSKSSFENFDETESSPTKQELQHEDESVEKIIEEAGSTMEDITVTLPEDTPPGIEKTFDDPIDNEWIDEPLPQTPERSLNATLPFLSDEPPEDDDESAWTTEDNFDDSELFFSPSSNDYSSVPLFDEVPPEDDAFVIPSSLKSTPIISSNLSEAVDNEVKFVQQNDEKISSLDEPDRSANVGTIRSKMNVFNRKQEEIESLPPVKKSLPGKLNSNLKINVGALMPGARPYREVVETRDEQSNDAPPLAASIAVHNSQQIEESGSNLLNNDFTKSRARIQAKRRPSTRRGRKSVYEKSTLEDETEAINPEEYAEKSDTSVSQASMTSSSSVFDTPESTAKVEQVISSSKDEKKIVTTNKISVFYDDEDDTRILVEQRKQKEKEEKSMRRDTAGLFDDDNEDDFFASLPPKKIQAAPTKVSKDVKSVHYDESDDDLFNVNPKITKDPVKTTKTVSNSSLTANSSLFDDEDEDDDLFASIAKKTNQLAKNTNKLSKSSLTSTSKTVSKVVQSKSSSLFGDDDDDDDDLFNSKPKASSKSSIKFQSSLTKTQKIKATNADDDPLKDLLNK